MKKFLYVLLCLLLIAGIGGSAVLLAKNINSDTQIEQCLSVHTRSEAVYSTSHNFPEGFVPPPHQRSQEFFSENLSDPLFIP